MALVLSKSPPEYNSSDIPGSLKKLHSYITYLYEQTDYAMGRLQRSSSAVSAETVAALSEDVSQHSGDIANLSSRLTTMAAQIGLINEAIAGLIRDSEELAAELAALDARVTAIEEAQA